MLLLTEKRPRLEPPSPPRPIGTVSFLPYIGKSVYVMNVKTAANLNTVFIFVYPIYKKGKMNSSTYAC